MKKKKSKVLSWLVPENVYRVPFYLILTDNREAGIKWLKENYVNDDYSFLGGTANGHFLWQATKNEAVVWITDPNDITCLAHELAHYTIAVLECRGVPIKEETSEAFTYLLQYALIACMLNLSLDKYVGKSVKKL